MIDYDKISSPEVRSALAKIQQNREKYNQRHRKLVMWSVGLSLFALLLSLIALFG